MVTLKRIERMVSTGGHAALLRELLRGRAEDLPAVWGSLACPAAAEAIAVIRMEELGRGNAPVVSRLIRSVLERQDPDGGWNDPMTTALCLRALLCWHGEGLAVDQGMAYLSRLQSDEGILPREPLRRMPADAVATAFVLLQLGASAAFRQAVRFDAMVGWFDRNAATEDADVRRLWAAAATRARRALPTPDHSAQPHHLTRTTLAAA